MDFSNDFYGGFCAGLEFARSHPYRDKAVNYARWLPLHSEEFPNAGKCSNCGYEYAKAIQTLTNYTPICPNCGAKMSVHFIDW